MPLTGPAALRVLDGLGARAAGAVVRKRLRDLGVTAVPRRPGGSAWSSGGPVGPRGYTHRRGRVGRAAASAAYGLLPRKVRTPQGRVVVNGNPG
jgi:hypothetical protein